MEEGEYIVCKFDEDQDVTSRQKSVLKDQDRVVVLWADETPVVIGKISKGKE